MNTLEPARRAHRASVPTADGDRNDDGARRPRRHASPDDPIDAMTAWTACAVLGAGAVRQPRRRALNCAPTTRTHPPTNNADGSWNVIVSMAPPPGVHEGYASIVALCDISGSLGAPKLLRWTLKDI